jgi:hypothetical protein
MTGAIAPSAGIPATTIRESHTTGVADWIASIARWTARDPTRADEAKLSSAVACTMRATTDLAGSDHDDRSTRDAMIE